ncbi:MAG: type II secretion system protein [Myxococcales bacterium]|nr:type II secretion system GspH family protein [Polyangiaceae bacterium]MDW8247871.1 type II secretion system protein [Myxococcales bacterium]
MTTPSIHPRHSWRSTRGFTLTEILIGIVIVGLLASLATVGYRKYMDGARMSEALATIQAIRVSEETVRRETGRYLDASVSNTYYPMNTNFGKVRVPWDWPAHPDYNNWRILEVAVDGPMRFGYKVNAGRAGTPITTPIQFSPVPQLPAPPTDEWYLIQAKGDPNEDGKPTHLLTASFSSELLISEDQL